LEEQAAELRGVVAEREAFARTLNHDLRGPLMSIGGFADLLLEQAGAQLDEKSRQYLLAIITSTEQLAHVLREAMAFSRVGRVELGGPVACAGAGRANGADEAIVAT
jgi:signal transduction histidine kinase